MLLIIYKIILYLLHEFCWICNDKIQLKYRGLTVAINAFTAGNIPLGLECIYRNLDLGHHSMHYSNRWRLKFKSKLNTC